MAAQAAKKAKVSDASEEYTVHIRDGGVADGAHIVVKLNSKPATCGEIVERYLEQRTPLAAAAAAGGGGGGAAAATGSRHQLQGQLPVLMIDCGRDTQPWRIFGKGDPPPSEEDYCDDIEEEHGLVFYGSATGIEFGHLVYDCSVCRMPFRPSDNEDDSCPVHGDQEPERRFKGHG